MQRLSNWAVIKIVRKLGAVFNFLLNFNSKHFNTIKYVFQRESHRALHAQNICGTRSIHEVKPSSLITLVKSPTEGEMEMMTMTQMSSLIFCAFAELHVAYMWGKKS